MDSAAATQANNIIDDILFDAPAQNTEPQTVNMNNIDHSKAVKTITSAKPKVCYIATKLKRSLILNRMQFVVV